MKNAALNNPSVQAFQAALNNYEEGRPAIAIRCTLDDLEEFAMFMENQRELDNIDESQTMQDRIDLKQVFYSSKELTLAIINKTNSPGT